MAVTHTVIDAFVHAEYLVAEPEWAQRGLLEGYGMTTKTITALASRVRTVTDGQEIVPGVQVRITAGHTLGTAEYVITSGGQWLIAFGDALHSPIQVDHPEWCAVVDHDPDRSADHHRRLVAELEEPDTIGFGIHFADVVFGQVHRDGAGSAWRPLETDPLQMRSRRLSKDSPSVVARNNSDTPVAEPYA